ncbi:TetR/AcrR family transcriptional regulator [Mycobacterium sp. MYCO198283]|uniref:TetR/AcrR family transcriptional regulator n=1 Tax=Mycobacterium sp. MYCO198283 TaxID=2883505 RepID=UPI001E508072|nr:TetR/AcrR family transcriptional regulator [Mycobacterium sp. MYCO198283]MCG5432269.1 TetR/AcrR family transcriptional regulator [Mycobacterium sp. MYCO198283]
MRRRPRDRKAQIAKASADAFSAAGYHAVSMEHIASRVGITAAALYRHAPGKYDLFRDAVLSLGQQLVDATAEPADQLADVVDALITTTLANRTAGGLYRWEGRYLRGDDRAELARQLKLVNRRVQAPLAALRPTLTSRQRWTLSAAVLSVIGSITDHRHGAPAAAVRRLLHTAAADIAAVQLPDAAPSRAAPPAGRAPAASTYERLLSESMRLFDERGFREAGMDDIALAVGIPASGIYRFFPGGKTDILATACRRAADRLSAELGRVAASADDPRRAVAALVDAFVAQSIADPHAGYVYFTERHHLSEPDVLALTSIRHATVEAWARLVTAARADLTLDQAHFAVHAVFALAVDLGRLAVGDEVLRRVMTAVLLGG